MGYGGWTLDDVDVENNPKLKENLAQSKFGWTLDDVDPIKINQKNFVDKPTQYFTNYDEIINNNQKVIPNISTNYIKTVDDIIQDNPQQEPRSTTSIKQPDYNIYRDATKNPDLFKLPEFDFNAYSSYFNSLPLNERSDLYKKNLTPEEVAFANNQTAYGQLVNKNMETLGFVGDIAAGITTGISQFPRAVRGAINTISGLFGGDTNVMPESEWVKSLRQERGKIKDSRTWYQNIPEDLATAGTVMIPSLILGGTPGLAVLGGVAGGSGAQTALEKGAEPWKAATQGTVEGVAEYQLEKMFGWIPGAHSALNALKGLLKENLKTIGKEILKKTGEEAIEEILAQPIAGTTEYLLGYNKNMPFFGDGGAIDPKQMAYEGLIGGLAGLGLGGTQIPAYIEQAKFVQNKIGNNFSSDVKLGLGMPQNTQSYWMAQDIGAKGLNVTIEDYEKYVDQLKRDMPKYMQKYQLSQATDTPGNAYNSESSLQESPLSSERTIKDWNINQLERVSPDNPNVKRHDPNLIAGQAVPSKVTPLNQTYIQDTNIGESPLLNANNVYDTNSIDSEIVQKNQDISSGDLSNAEPIEIPNLQQRYENSIERAKKSMESNGIDLLDIKVVEPKTLFQKQLSQLYKAMGLDVIYYESYADFADGFFDPVEPTFLYVNSNSKQLKTKDGRNMIASSVGHEAFHSLFRSDPDSHNEMVNFVKDNLSLDQITKFLDTYNGTPQLAEYYRKNPGELYSEIAADEFANNMTDANFWDKLYKQSKTLFEKLANLIRDLFRQISGHRYETFLTAEQIRLFRAKVENAIQRAIERNENVGRETVRDEEAKRLDNVAREDDGKSSKQRSKKSKGYMEEGEEGFEPWMMFSQRTKNARDAYEQKEADYDKLPEDISQDDFEKFHEEWNALLQELENALSEDLGGQTAAKILNPKRPDRMELLSPSFSKDNEFRITHFYKDEPTGHSEYKTLAQAVKDLVMDGFTDVQDTIKFSKRKKDVVKPFYSKMQQVIESKMSTISSKDQVYSIIRNNGVKQDEIKWSGLNDYLKDKDKVNKRELLDFLRMNELTIQETEKGKLSSISNWRDYVINGNDLTKLELSLDRDGWLDDNGYLNFIDDNGEDMSRFFWSKYDGVFSDKLFDAANKNPTKYSNYQLPDGKNYREMLFQLPLKIVEQYTSSHWDEPNILAHVRLNDRKDSQYNNVLFVEEIQSDWHQEGRKTMYKSEYESFKKPFVDFLNEKGVKAQNDSISLGMLINAGASYEMQRQFELFMKKIKGYPVPDAPFQKTWHEFVLKRLIRYAAENGYDYISWTSGKQQNKRYGLSDIVSYMHVVRGEGADSNSYSIDAFDDNEKIVISNTYEKDEMAAVIGQELTNKIVQDLAVPGQGRTYNKLDLEIGGSGMKGFYDKIIPDFLNQYGKRWQAKVGTIRFNTILENSDTWEVFDVRDGNVIKVFDTKSDAEEYYNRLPMEKRQWYDYTQESAVKHQAFPITESMKESVMTEGQPLFSARKKGNGNQWPKNFPELINMTNLSTLEDKKNGNFELLKKAKSGDLDAALELVARVAKEDRIIDIGKKYPNATIVPVHAQEASGLNKLPIFFAIKIQSLTGLDINSTIVQTNRAQRTEKSRIERLFQNVEFDGDVKKGYNYIIVDDVVTQGGTVRRLREYIEDNDGNVVAIASLSPGFASPRQIAITDYTLNRLKENFGYEEIRRVLNEFGIADSPEELTEAEGRDIIKSFRSIDAFRNRGIEERFKRQPRGSTQNASGMGSKEGIGKKDDGRTKGQKYTGDSLRPQEENTSTEVEVDEDTSKFSSRRKEVKSRIADEADLESILMKARDWKTKTVPFFMSRETPERVIEMTAKKDAPEIIKTFIAPIKKHVADKNRWEREMFDRLDRMKIQDNLFNKRNHESAALMKYIEQQYVKVTKDANGNEKHEVIPYTEDDLRREFPETFGKIKAAAEDLSKMYDEILRDVNFVLEGLGYDPIPRRNHYVAHMDEIGGIFEFLGIPLSAENLPTAINGLTDDFTPYKSFFANALPRYGLRTKYDALGNTRRYIKGISNLIFLTEDINRLRLFEDGIRNTFAKENYFLQVKVLEGMMEHTKSTYAKQYSKKANEIDNLIKDLLSDPQLSMFEHDKNMTIQELLNSKKRAKEESDRELALELEKLNLKKMDLASIASVTSNEHLNTFASWLHEYTNSVANKKARIDRGMIESFLGRAGYSLYDFIDRQLSANMVGYNVGSALTNFIPLIYSVATTNKASTILATIYTMKSMFYDDGFVEKSDFLTRRLKEVNYSQGIWGKAIDFSFMFMKAVDWFSANLIVRSKYIQLRSSKFGPGMSHEDAIEAADDWASRIMADRSKGSQPNIFNSRVMNLIGKFQIEVNNTLSTVYKDIPRKDWSKEAGQFGRIFAEKSPKAYNFAMIMWIFAQILAYSYLFNLIFQMLLGRKPAPDPIDIAMTAYKNMTDPNVPYDKAATLLVKKIAQNIPFIGSFVGGGRIPITNAMPDLIGMITGDVQVDDFAKEFLKIPYLVFPGGGGQFKKIVEGVNSAFRDAPGVYGKSGEQEVLKYPIADTIGNKIRSVIGGKYATPESIEYFENFRTQLSPVQTRVVQDAKLNAKDEIAVYNAIIKYNQGRKLINKSYEDIRDGKVPIDTRIFVMHEIYSKFDNEIEKLNKASNAIQKNNEMNGSNSKIDAGKLHNAIAMLYQRANDVISEINAKSKGTK
jgi:hypothetical protein